MATGNLDQSDPSAVRFSNLFIDPSSHPNPAGVASAAQCASALMLDQVKAIADLLFLADQNQDSAFNEDTVANAALLIKQLVEQKQVLDELEFAAREAARAKTGALRAVTA